MRLALKDFRAFQETPLLEIRPLTFLVGENSSGKTSLLAALNYIWRFQERVIQSGLNTPPFDLGTFDEIVHRVRGRTKPKSFELLVEDHVNLDPQRSPLFISRGSIGRSSGIVRMRMTFSSNVGDAMISKLHVHYDDLELFIDIRDSIRVIVKKDHKQIFDSLAGQDNINLGRRIGRIEVVGLGELTFYLRRLVREAAMNRDDEITEAEQALSIISLAFEQLTRTFPSAIFASAPVRSNPSRVYTPSEQIRSPDGTHTPQRLFKIKESDEARWTKIKSGLEKFGQQSGMFSAINVARYRSSGSSPFHINVTRRGKQSNIVDVGYGVSQALPILTDLIESPPKSGFLFQQPEVHLHPQAQAALGSFFVDYIANHRNAKIVAETHSDYLIDRVRLAIREGHLRASDVSLLYFETAGSATSVHQMEIDSEGNIINTPSGYRSFFIKEQMSLLGIDDECAS